MLMCMFMYNMLMLQYVMLCFIQGSQLLSQEALVFIIFMFRVMIYPTPDIRQRTQMVYHILSCDLTYLKYQTGDVDGLSHVIMAINIVVLYGIRFYIHMFIMYVYVYVLCFQQIFLVGHQAHSFIFICAGKQLWWRKDSWQLGIVY